MREHVLSLRALAGDRVSEEHLKAELYHRAEALRDLPDAPLFFGRLDYAPGEPDGVAGRSLHIGRRHVHAPDGTPVVIDWRAPVSRPFYRASAADPRRRRRAVPAPHRARDPDPDGGRGGGLRRPDPRGGARSRPVRAAADAMWPKVDPVRLVFGLLSSPWLLAAAAGGRRPAHARGTGRDHLVARAARARHRALVRGGRGARRRGA